MQLIIKVLSGYFAGLSVGVYCLGLCLPVFLPVLLSAKRTTRTSFFLVMEFTLGRLFGYLFFGLIIGWLGKVIQSSFFHYIVALANIWTGILMKRISFGYIFTPSCTRNRLEQRRIFKLTLLTKSWINSRLLQRPKC